MPPCTGDDECRCGDCLWKRLRNRRRASVVELCAGGEARDILRKMDEMEGTPDPSPSFGRPTAEDDAPVRSSVLQPRRMSAKPFMVSPDAIKVASDAAEEPPAATPVGGECKTVSLKQFLGPYAVLTGDEVNISAGLTDEHAKTIVKVMTDNKTKRLILRRNSLGDQTAIAIAEALKEGTCCLEALSLHGNDISDEGARALADALVTNTSLTSLFLTFNPRLSEAGCNAVRKANQSRTMPLAGLCGLVLDF